MSSSCRPPCIWIIEWYHSQSSPTTGSASKSAQKIGCHFEILKFEIQAQQSFGYYTASLQARDEILFAGYGPMQALLGALCPVCVAAKLVGYGRGMQSTFTTIF